MVTVKVVYRDNSVMYVKCDDKYYAHKLIETLKHSPAVFVSGII